MEQDQEQSQTSSNRTQAQLRIEKSQVVYFNQLKGTTQYTTTDPHLSPLCFFSSKCLNI